MKVFKKCPMCSTVWQDRDEFLGDDTLIINGYQADFEYLQDGLFYFTHEVDGCFSTMTMKVNLFYDLGPPKMFTERKTLTEECPQYCLDKGNLKTCDAECECAHIRNLLGVLQRHKSESKLFN